MIAAIAGLLARVQPLLTDVALLVLRVVYGGMMLFGHGLGKLRGFSEMSEGFPDPLGIGSTASLAGAVFGEFVCAALLVAGLATRLAAIPLVFTMGVAAFVIHAGDPLFMGGGAAKEPALLFLGAYVALALLGPGRFSIDARLARGKTTKADAGRQVRTDE